MTRRCLRIDPILNGDWDAFVSQHEHGSLYHGSHWAELISKSYSYKPEYLALVENDGSIKSAVPLFIVQSRLTGKRVVSLPFSDCSDFLTRKPEETRELFKHIFELSNEKKISHVEIRARKNPEFLLSTPFSSVKSYKNHILSLDENLSSINRKFHKKTLYDIAKAEKSGLQIRFAENENDMKCFYNLYAGTRKFHGLLPQPYGFFKNMWLIFRRENKIDMLFAMDGKKAIAGILLLKFKDIVYYLYAGMDRERANKRPSYFLLWRAISFAHDQKFKYFDFGRTHADNKGLLTFKHRWATEVHDIWSFSYGEKGNSKLLVNRNSNQLHSLIQSIFKRTPAFFLKIAGEMIYKHIG